MQDNNNEYNMNSQRSESDLGHSIHSPSTLSMSNLFNDVGDHSQRSETLIDTNRELESNQNQENAETSDYRENPDFGLNEDQEEEDYDNPDIEGTNVITLYVSNTNPIVNHIDNIQVPANQDSMFPKMNFTPKQLNRASTAPARPLKELEQFKQSREFYALETVVMSSNKLVQKSDNKFDLDSKEGQNSCKEFLKKLEELCIQFKANYASREYRNKFSAAYKVLYKEGTLCYLTEILDSAQEGFPFLWVNGEKYVFSKDVLTAGRELFDNFCKLKQKIRSIYAKILEEYVTTCVIPFINELKSSLSDFDLKWAKFEQLYVLELMLIENDARRYIVQGIKIEKEISGFEQRERMKGKIVLDCNEYNEIRREFVKVIGQINSVANPEGVGRDDLDVEILRSAENILRKVSNIQSRAVRSLASKIKSSFTNLRNLFKKFDENIEVVDPQLKNNSDLAKGLKEFEESWEKGKEYFINSKRCSQLIHFSQIVENACEKYNELKSKMEDMDSEIFVIIPCLLVLNSLDGDDKKLCQTYFPPIESKNSKERNHYLEISQLYSQMKKNSKDIYKLYNIVEMRVLEKQIKKEELIKLNIDENKLEELVLGIKGAAISLQRYNPTDWNTLIETVLSFKET